MFITPSQEEATSAAAAQASVRRPGSRLLTTTSTRSIVLCGNDPRATNDRADRMEEGHGESPVTRTLKQEPDKKNHAVLVITKSEHS